MAVIDTAQLNGALSRFGKAHAGAATFSGDTLVCNFIIFRISAVGSCGDLF